MFHKKVEGCVNGHASLFLYSNVFLFFCIVMYLKKNFLNLVQRIRGQVLEWQFLT